MDKNNFTTEQQEAMKKFILAKQKSNNPVNIDDLPRKDTEILTKLYNDYDRGSIASLMIHIMQDLKKEVNK